MTAKQHQWGSAPWQEAQFPADELDTVGDKWGIRWRGMEKMRHASYLRLLGTVLRASAPLRVLDVGCALCDFTAKAAALNRSNSFCVTDVAENAILWVQKRYPMFEAKAAPLPDIPFDGPFDAVLCLEVLCYLNSDQRVAAIAAIHSRLKPGGALLLSGVLDGGRRYHTEKELTALIAEKFDVEQVGFNYWRLYKRLIERPLDHLDGMLAAAQRRDRSVGTSGHDGASKLKQLLARAGSKAVRYIVSIRLLAEIGRAVSRAVLRTANADEIILLARKK